MERMIDENNFAENLKLLRLRKGINQAQLAKGIGVSAGIVSLWEHSKREPLMSSLIAIARYFNISLNDLVGVPSRNDILSGTRFYR